MVSYYSHSRTDINRFGCGIIETKVPSIIINNNSQLVDDVEKNGHILNHMKCYHNNYIWIYR